MTADEKSSIPVCCKCGTPADPKQRLAIGMLEAKGCFPRAYCLRCWSKSFPEIAARQAEKPIRKKRPAADLGEGKQMGLG
jgi:hypothetical protein